MTDQAKPMDREAWEKRLKEIEARCESATRGEYCINRYDHGGCRVWVESNRSRDLVFDSYNEGDREMLIGARQDIPDLVAYARALQTQLTEALAEVERLRGRLVQTEKEAPIFDALMLELKGSWHLYEHYADQLNEARGFEKARQPK